MNRVPSINENQRSIILNLVRRSPAISRGKIRDATGIRLATIGSIIRSLKRDHLLLEVRNPRPGMKGRRTGLLRLNADGRHAVGISFASHQVTGVVMNLAGSVVGERRVQLGGDASKQTIIRTACRAIHELIDGLPPRSRIAGIGFVDPGTIDIERGLSLYSNQYPSWKNVPIVEILNKEFGLPVYLSNGQCARALAEHYFSKGPPKDNFVFVSWGFGISCAAFIGGRLIQGAHHVAGELGYARMPSEGAGGDLQTVASLAALKETLQSILPEDPFAQTHWDLSALASSLKKGERTRVQQAIEQTLGHLAGVMGMLVLTLDPETLILDSNLGRLGETLLGRFIGMIRDELPDEYVERLRIVLSELGDRSSALGGGALVIDDLFRVPS